MVQAAVWPQPLACMGQEALPQQEGLFGRFALATTASAKAGRVPSTAAQTGVSVNIPGAWAARIKAARPRARMERMRPASYTMRR